MPTMTPLQPRRTRFRPCIDLHDGLVKQIVGGSLDPSNPTALKTNFVSSHAPAYFAGLYRDRNLTGAHVIKLGNGNEQAAKEALAEWKGHLQIGGGITIENAKEWIVSNGAAKVIITSYLFPNGRFSLERLQKLCDLVGKEKIVIDVSCRRRGEKWIVAMDKWQVMTDMEVNQESLDMLSQYCSEFLIHAADVEGLCNGIDKELVKKLGEWVTIPTTYAGGGNSINDLELVNRLSNGKVDLTLGSALDIFGGRQVSFEECVKWNEGGNSCDGSKELCSS